VDNLKAKIAAEKLAENTTGVVGVYNRIKVRPKDYPSASEIELSIQQVLENNANTNNWDILADVRGGIATLTGVVNSYLEKTEAEWVVASVEGVVEVNNQLQVHYPNGYYWWGYYPFYDIYSSPSPVGTMVPNDNLIAKKVEDEIWWSPFVDRDQLTITVKNGEVTLTGHVDSWKEYRKAAENAWEGGAWSVNNKLVVK
jgi:osmotically-inducible protein OsmY